MKLECTHCHHQRTSTMHLRSKIKTSQHQCLGFFSWCWDKIAHLTLCHSLGIQSVTAVKQCQQKEAWNSRSHDISAGKQRGTDAYWCSALLLCVCGTRSQPGKRAVCSGKLPTSIKIIRLIPNQHTYRPVSHVILDLIKLSQSVMKIKHVCQSQRRKLRGFGQNNVKLYPSMLKSTS